MHIESSPSRIKSSFLIFLLFLIALGFYGFHLGQPDQLYWDEVIHINGARTILYGQKPYAELTQTPLARETLVASLWIFGDNPWGARALSALAGALSLVLVYGIGKQFTQNYKIGIFAAGFLLFDPLFYVHSRIGMPDIFLTFFMLLSFAWFLRMKTPDLPLSPSFVKRGKNSDPPLLTKERDGERSLFKSYLLLGIFTGLAIAIKTVAFILVPIYLFGIFFSPPLSKGLPAGSLAGDTGGFKNGKSLLSSLYKRQAILNGLIFLLPIPLLFWIPYLLLGYSLAEMKDHLVWLWDFLRNFKADTSIISHWYDWLIGQKPVWYLNKETDSGALILVLLIGNLVFWLAAEISFVALLFC